MSIDLDWTNLDASFASSLIDVLNRQLQSTPRPSFIGPIEITSFDFGSQPPVVELVDLRDIYRDFLEDDDGDDDEVEIDNDGGYENNVDVAGGFPRYSSAGQGRGQGRRRDRDEEEYEWVSRRSARRGMAMEETAPMYYHHLPPHVRYARGPASDVYSAPPAPLQQPSSSSSSVGRSRGVASAATHPELQHASSTFSLSPSAFAADNNLSSSWRDFHSGQHQQTVRTHSLDDAHSTTRPTGMAVPAPPSAAAAASSLSPLPRPHPHPHLADVDDVVATAAIDPSLAAAATTTTTAVMTTTAMKDNAGVAAELTTIPTVQVDPTAAAAPPPAEVPAADEHPNLQLHLLVSWHSDLRLTLTTSLRINYPSPLFMSLPIKLSVTGLVFDGELAVAYEGGRRVHLCVLDGLDPYGPSARRASGSQGSTPSDPEGDDAHAAKPLPVGQRLLPEIFIESELGQADKHVLKNVTRVEKFIQDVIRKTIEEELVFPNFHTLVLR
jgi:mitochondrial distribution and morphology protein 12